MTDDWHTSDYPDLRPGPPWVMEEMIRAQAALPDDLAALDGAHAIHAAAARALAAGDEIVVVGCGTSEHAAMAIAALLAGRSGDLAPRRAADPGAAGPRCCARSCAGRPRHRRQPRRRDTRHLARARPRASRRRRHRGDHRPRRLGRRGGGRPRPLDAAPRSLVVPHGGLHERHPGRARRSPTPSRARPGRRSRGPRSKPPLVSRRRPNRRASPLPGTASAVRRNRVGPHQCPRARAQDRGGRAHRRDRPSPRDPAPWAPGRLRARSDANRLPRRRPQPRRSVPPTARPRHPGHRRDRPSIDRHRTPGILTLLPDSVDASSSSSRPATTASS